MQVTLSATGPLKRMVSDGLVLDLRDGARLRDALSEACGRLGEEAATRVFNGAGDLQPGIVVVVNDELIRRGGDRELSDGDDLTILMPVAGG